MKLRCLVSGKNIGECYRKIRYIYIENTRRDYEYKGVDDRNLPYRILITHQAINIYDQKISNTDIGLKIRDAIIHKSKYFKLETEENGGIVQKEKNL